MERIKSVERRIEWYCPQISRASCLCLPQSRAQWKASKCSCSMTYVCVHTHLDYQYICSTCSCALIRCLHMYHVHGRIAFLGVSLYSMCVCVNLMYIPVKSHVALYTAFVLGFRMCILSFWIAAPVIYYIIRWRPWLCIYVHSSLWKCLSCFRHTVLMVHSTSVVCVYEWCVSDRVSCVGCYHWLRRLHFPFRMVWRLSQLIEWSCLCV